MAIHQEVACQNLLIFMDKLCGLAVVTPAYQSFWEKGPRKILRGRNVENARETHKKLPILC